MSRTWRKSSRSTSTGGNCVETAPLGPRVAVRDSKNPEMGHLTVSTRHWQTFTTAIRSGKL